MPAPIPDSQIITGPETMPPVTTGPLPEGYTHSPYHNALIRNDLVAVGREDQRILHRGHAYHCPQCGDPICYRGDRESYTIYMHDTDRRWCIRCAEDDAFQDDDDRYWEREPTGHGIRDYHHGERKVEGTSHERPFLIGFEIEKEDLRVREGLADRTPECAMPKGWAAERDSSLNSNTGFEVITPAYNLADIERIKADMDKAAFIADAGFSKSCGGHINISDARYSAREFAKRIRPLFPMMMALYPKRLVIHFAQGKKVTSVGSEKYCAFRYKDGRIELRCPSAVRSLKNLKWRLDLVSYFVLSSHKGPLDWRWMKKELSMGGHLRTMLAKAYCKDGSEAKDPVGAANVKRVIQLYRAFSVWFYTNKEPNDIIRLYLGYGPSETVVPEPHYQPEPIGPPGDAPQSEHAAFRAAHRVWERDYQSIYDHHHILRRRADEARQALLEETLEDQLV